MLFHSHAYEIHISLMVAHFGQDQTYQTPGCCNHALVQSITSDRAHCLAGVPVIWSGAMNDRDVSRQMALYFACFVSLI